MSTRSLTRFCDDDGKPFACMYRQMDGYPSGHGKDLAEYLSQGKLVNGLSLVEKGLVFNGMECLAASVVAHFKDGPGSFYLFAPQACDVGEEYVYTVSPGDAGAILIRVEETNPTKLLFEGTAAEALIWAMKKDE